MVKKKINNIHDKLFRASMQYPELAREFLELHLPEDIKNNIDFSSIVVCPNSFIDEELKLLQSDVLFKVLISGKETYLYILAEHQSKADPLMALRLMKYMIKIWDFYCQQSGSKTALPLPVIVPLVFYTGKKQYNAVRTLADLCGKNSEIMRNILQEPYLLIDVNTIPEEKLTSRMWAGTMEFIMRNQFKQHLDVEFQKIAYNLNKLALEHHGKLVLELITYIINVDDEHRTIQELMEIMHEQLSPNVENEIMSLAEKIRDEGRKEGELRGELRGELKGEIKKSLQIAQAMLDAGSDPVFVVKVTGLSMSEVQALRDK